MVERRLMGMRVAVEADVEVEEVFAWLRWVDATFSTYRRDSQVSRLNRGVLARRDADPLVREVLDRCEALRAETDGYFDARAPAAGPTGVVGPTERLGGPVDPTGLVKGWAVDRAAALLDAAGAERYCVDAGGDLRLRGGPWRVGIRHPGRRRRLAAVLDVTDAAVATSGAYERGAHIVDPFTRGAAAGALSVTVVGPDLATADAYATAAFAMGSRGPAWTARLEGFDAMTILAGGRVLSTPGFLARCGGSSVAAGLSRAAPWPVPVRPGARSRA